MRPGKKDEKPEEKLELWTVYERPLDYPDHYVVRQWKISPHGPIPGPAQLADSLEHARRLVPPYTYRLDPLPGDDPCIVEVWV